MTSRGLNALNRRIDIAWYASLGETVPGLMKRFQISHEDVVQSLSKS